MSIDTLQDLRRKASSDAGRTWFLTHEEAKAMKEEGARATELPYGTKLELGDIKGVVFEPLSH